MKSKTYWFVGANMDQNGDQTQRFIEEGIWENSLYDEYGDLVNAIQVGDRIAIKQTHNKREQLPFDYHNKMVSVMEIKATGIVTGNLHNRRTITVQWKKAKKAKEWYFFTYIRLIWKVEPNPDNWMFQALIDFTFNHKPQDIGRFMAEPYWGNKLVHDDEVSLKNEIIAVLRLLGGEASLTRIQDEIQRRNRLREIKTDPDWRAAVRFTLQRCSSDSKSFAHGDDLFYMQSFHSGIWGLRETKIKKSESYSPEEFLAEINISPSDHVAVSALVRNKKSVIIKRMSGVGKNRLPEYLSYALMKEKDNSRLLIVQLDKFFCSKKILRHYYDQGKCDFFLTEVLFMNFCKKALADTEKDYYFVIDDISWENLSRILMDLLFLFRRDRRNSGIDKYFTGEIFCIPDNLYVMVMMDTGEKSTAFIENILGRRFCIMEIEPVYDSKGAVNYIKKPAEKPDVGNEQPKVIRGRKKHASPLDAAVGI